MATETIQIEVPAEVARRFREAPDAERQRLINWMAMELLDDSGSPGTLRDAVDALRAEARRRGMTAEDIREILGGDELEGCL